MTPGQTASSPVHRARLTLGPGGIRGPRRSAGNNFWPSTPTSRQCRRAVALPTVQATSHAPSRRRFSGRQAMPAMTRSSSQQVAELGWHQILDQQIAEDIPSGSPRVRGARRSRGGDLQPERPPPRSFRGWPAAPARIPRQQHHYRSAGDASRSGNLWLMSNRLALTM